MEQLKKGVWLAAVSGGADSMAMLDICRSSGIRLHAAHVNYHKRESAMRDQRLCEAYCHIHGIPFHCLRAENRAGKNFQAEARRERYAFFASLCQRYSLSGVLVAHQQDDVLETYVMQKQRGSVPQHYGLQADTVLHGVRVIRPLLDHTRAQLRAYCLSAGIAFGDDESNAADDYQRNRVRHHLIAPLDAAQRSRLLEQISVDNARLQARRERAAQFLRTWDHEVGPLLAQDDPGWLLQQWILERCQIALSAAALQDLCRQLHSGRPQWSRRLDQEWQLNREYTRLSVARIETCGYCYVYDSVQALYGASTPYFRFASSGRVIEGVTLTADDFPLRVRNVREGDLIRLRIGRKRIHRWFIDRHIPMAQRKVWPVMENARGDVIFVPQIGCDIAHFSANPTVFMLQ